MNKKGKDLSASQLWSEFSQNYKTEAIALAEAIRLLNKWFKTTELNRNLKRQVYLIKDEWIQKHEQYLTEFYISSISGYSENFQQLYAYTFCIDGEFFCFHSYLRLKQNTKVYITHHGSSKELLEEQIRLLETELPLFIRMVKHQLQSIQPVKD
ncbi:hypothetical protein [Nostoc sp. FACHB-133]|uniref:hypothetical protein n=1 Tax=Nostoc sp. FACHB-133 TaxID=2692835 RepID=UPI0016820F0B|nr:hypothetical protein [Nostoc sp. FACHB-133]MBD2522843.1 hypothetical protein [Nostoc sp. FACHB-133]